MLISLFWYYSEAKGSFAFTTSPPGDSVESSGRPGCPSGRETNSADNLLLFDAENDKIKGERNSKCHNKSNIPPSKQSSPLDGTHNAKESEDLSIRLAVKSQAYARRNRSRTSRDFARVSSTELPPVSNGKGSSALPSSWHSSRNVKGSLCEATVKKDCTASSICNSKSRNPPKTVSSVNQLDMEINAPLALGKDMDLAKDGTLGGELDATTLKDLRVNEHNLRPQIDGDQVTNITKFVSPEMARETGGVPSVPDCNKMGNLRADEEVPNEGQNNMTACNRKHLDSESSFTQVGYISSDQSPAKINSTGNAKELESVIEEASDIAVVKNKESSGTKDVGVVSGDDCNPVQKNQYDGSSIKVEEEICGNRSGLKDGVELICIMEGIEANDTIILKAERSLNSSLSDDSNTERKASCPQGRPPSTSVSSQCDLPGARSSLSVSEPEPNSCAGRHVKLANEAHEDSVLEEARIIEVIICFSILISGLIC